MKGNDFKTTTTVWCCCFCKVIYLYKLQFYLLNSHIICFTNHQVFVR